MSNLKLADYISDIEYPNESPIREYAPKSEPEKETALFESVNLNAGYGIPTDHYWKLWHSPQKAMLIEAQLVPRRLGYELGANCGWVVILPVQREGYTRAVGDLMAEIGIQMLTRK